ncbi:MAG TPA: hypothetical protein VI138_00905, partial [Candidatus Dormibacteraeota bacterium]
MLSVGVVLVAVSATACASQPTRIPAASAKPSAEPTTIAPGVSVNPAQLALPPYSVSATNPLGSGVSAKQVVRDLVIDNLVENAALKTADASLLMYSDAGAVLVLDEQQISANVLAGVQVLSVEDTVSSMELGARIDPDNPASHIAIVVHGVQVMRQRK